MWRRAARHLCRQECDLIVFYSPSIFLATLVRRLKRLWRCPSYLVLRDLFPQWTVDSGILKPGPLVGFLRWKERQLYAAADVIGVQSTGSLKYFEDRFSRENYRLEVLYNWMSLDEPPVTHQSHRTRLGLQDKVVFFYGGNIGLAQDMDNIVRLAQRLRDDPRIFFLILGDGSEAAPLRRRLAGEGHANILFLPAVDQQQYLSWVAEMDVGLVSLHRALRTPNVPGKMLGYMYFRLPTLASLNPGNDLAAIIDRHQVGLWCVNGDDDLLAAHARRLTGDPELRRQLGENAGRLLRERFSAGTAASQILAAFPPALSERPWDRAAGVASRG
jgi:glycosyltransferase involved in cell wall biosynthesis